jgi:N-acetylornithine carbamoyltransferase
MARVLSRMGDAIAIRILGGAVNWEYEKSLKIINEFAKWSTVPVINMEDNKYHPCQGMADVMTCAKCTGVICAAASWPSPGLTRPAPRNRSPTS